MSNCLSPLVSILWHLTRPLHIQLAPISHIIQPFSACLVYSSTPAAVSSIMLYTIWHCPIVHPPVWSKEIELHFLELSCCTISVTNKSEGGSKFWGCIEFGHIILQCQALITVSHFHLGVKPAYSLNTAMRCIISQVDTIYFSAFLYLIVLVPSAASHLKYQQFILFLSLQHRRYTYIVKRSIHFNCLYDIHIHLPTPP